MPKQNPQVIIAALFLTLSLILAGCSLTGTEGDPYSAGQKARTEFDQATEKAGDFVAGFCSASPAADRGARAGHRAAASQEG